MEDGELSGKCPSEIPIAAHGALDTGRIFVACDKGFPWFGGSPKGHGGYSFSWVWQEMECWGLTHREYEYPFFAAHPMEPWFLTPLKSP